MGAGDIRQSGAGDIRQLGDIHQSQGTQHLQSFRLGGMKAALAVRIVSHISLEFRLVQVHATKVVLSVADLLPPFEKMMKMVADILPEAL